MTKNTTKATNKIGQLKSRITLSVIKLMTYWVTTRTSPRETDREWHYRGKFWDWLVKLLSDMFTHIWLIFHHTKMLIRKRRGRTMRGHNYKIIRHYNTILGHKRWLLLDSKNQNLRANKSLNSKRQFDIMSNHFDFVKTI